MRLVTIRIPVTEQHLTNGVTNRFQYCAVAAAMKEVFTGTLFGVWGDKIEFVNAYKVGLPASVAHIIKVLDQGGQVAPFDFELEIGQYCALYNLSFTNECISFLGKD